MKFSYAPLFCCLLMSTAWADDNGGLKKARHHRHRMPWTTDIAVPRMHVS